MLTLLHVLPLAVAAHSSFSLLPSGNGFGTAVYDLAQAKIVNLREHAFQSVDAGVPTRDLLYDSYFGLRANGKEAWLNGAPVDRSDLDGGVITIVQHMGGLTATQTYFAPFGVNAPSLVMTMEVKNEGAQPISDVHAFTLHNAHLGGGNDGTSGQRVDWSAPMNAYVQKALGAGRVMLIRSVTPPSRHTTTPNNPYGAVMQGNLYTDTDSSGDANDVASGFQYDIGTLAPGASATFGVVLAYHPFGDINALDAMTAAYLKGKAPAELAAAEHAQWAAWLAAAKLPAGLSTDEQKLYRQQLAVLRMGQVREPNDIANSYLPFGQLTGSVRPGHWDIAWVRDACLGISALSRAGYLDEARAALEFMLRAQSGNYQQFVGRPYRISVVRYFGKGKEEADSDQNGPNIEFDGFGMFLWAASQYLDQGGDVKFLDTWWSTMSEGIADVLVALIEPQSQLLAADSSIWESHWDNGGRQHYTWSNLWAVVGLRRAALWATGRDASRAMKYQMAAKQLQNAIAARLVTNDHVLRPSLENQGTVDAAAVEAFNQGVSDPGGVVAGATLDAFLSKLAVQSGHGLKRNQNGGSYDEREWIVIDLRTSVALRRAGRADASDALWNWVRDQALLNHGLMPELFDQVTADYAGEVPMVGFGAGAFIVSAWDRAATMMPLGDGGMGAPDLSIGGGDGASPPGDAATSGDLATGGSGKGCGCAVGASSPSRSEWLCALLFVAFLLRMRRR